MICELKLHSQGFYWKKLRALHALEDLEPLLKIFYTFVCMKVPGKLQTNVWKIQSKPLEKFKQGKPAKFFRTILCFVALVYNCRHLKNKICQTSRPLSPSCLPLRAHFHQERETSGYQAATQESILLNSKALWRNLANRAFYIDLTAFECRDKMACFDLKGRLWLFYLAFKNFPCWIAQKFYCIYLRKTPCSFYR